MISCQDLTHLTILLGYTVKAYVIKTIGVYIIKNFWNFVCSIFKTVHV